MTGAGRETARLRTIVFADGVLAQPMVEALLHGGWLVGLCTTQRAVQGAPLRHLARLANIPTYQADRESLAGGLEAWLDALRPDVLLTFTFPYRLPVPLLSLPRLGGFNVHGGKLPEYRGPQPVFWQIVNREAEGAVTIHRMDQELDHGAIVTTQRVPIGAEDTYGLHLAHLTYAALKAVELLFGGLIQFGGQLPTTAQDERRAGFQRRPVPDDLVIRWEEQSGDRIRGLVKAGNPWNQGAFASVRGVNLRITDVTLIEGGGSPATPPGTILTADARNGTIVNCRDGSALQLDIVSMTEGILPGRMLAVYGIRAGERFVVPSGVPAASPVPAAG